MSELNQWFLSLPEGRQKALLDGDRWMLAEAAWQARAAVQAAQPEAVGWKLVPTEPTRDMINAGQCGCMDNDVTVCVWKAMLASAPTPEPMSAPTAEPVAAVSSIDQAQRDGYFGQPSEWREVCRLYRSRCNEQDIAAIAKLHAYIEDGLLEVRRPSAPTAEPVAWTLTETLTKGKTTTTGYLWFTDPQNSGWTALYATPPSAATHEPSEREAFDAWVAQVKPRYWQAEAWQTEAWAMWQSISAALATLPSAASDAKRWQFISDRYSVAFLNGKFTSLNSVVSEEWRQSLNASVDRMMAGDWSDADAAEEKSAEPEDAIQQPEPHPDTLRLDAIEQRRIALTPEYEGPWDAKIYGEAEVPWVVGTSSTVREAIDAAIRATKGGKL